METYRIYNYFRDTYGIIDDPVNTEIKDRYKDSSVRVLKRDLRNLKTINIPVHEIQYVLQLICGRVANPKSTGISTAFTDHDKFISKSFWRYVKRTIQNKPPLLPSFSLDSCNKYCLSLFSAKAPNRSFRIPSWIPAFTIPSIHLIYSPHLIKE